MWAFPLNFIPASLILFCSSHCACVRSGRGIRKKSSLADTRHSLLEISEKIFSDKILKYSSSVIGPSQEKKMILELRGRFLRTGSGIIGVLVDSFIWQIPPLQQGQPQTAPPDSFLHWNNHLQYQKIRYNLKMVLNCFHLICFSQ